MICNIDAVNGEAYTESQLQSKRNLLSVIAKAWDAIHEGTGGYGQGSSRAQEVSNLSDEYLFTRFFMPKERIDGTWTYRIDASEVIRL